MINTITITNTTVHQDSQRQTGDCRCLHCQSLQPREALIHRLYPRKDLHLELSLTQLMPGQRYPLGGGELSIGREENNQIIVPNDVSVSRHHCCISLDRDQYWIYDLGSRHGTQVNGRYVIGREVLTRNDIVKVGHTLFVVE